MLNHRFETPDVITIPMNGYISASGNHRDHKGINPDKFEALLDGVDLSRCQLIILDINSGGGSPVGSAMIHEKILSLKEEFDVVAHCRDVCASGAYMIVSACDAVYAHKSSLIGSIGVIMSGFGLDRFIDRHHVDYREFTAGTNKGFLSPFKPVDEEKEAYIQELLDNCHQEFIDMVYSSRKNEKMKDNKEEITTAKVFSGTQALDLGLIDGFKSPNDIIKKYTNKKRPKILALNHKESLFKRLFSVNVNVQFDDLMKFEHLMRF
jgi:protease-4